MIAKEVIRGCDILIKSNKGISLKEEYVLQDAMRIHSKNHKTLNYIELVTLAKRNIYSILGRKNITPRDLKKAIINLIVL